MKVIEIMDIDAGYKLINANGDVVEIFDQPYIFVKAGEFASYVRALDENAKIDVKEFRHYKIKV